GEEGELTDPTGVRDVRLDEVHGPARERRREGLPAEPPLAGGDRDGRPPSDLLQGVEAVRWARLLEPDQRERLQLLRDGRGGPHVEPAVGVDEELDVGADRVA